MNIRTLYQNTDNYDVPVLSVDLYNRVKYVNTTFEKVFQVSRQKLLNQDVAWFFGEHAFQNYVQHYIHKAGNGKLVSHVLPLTMLNGLKQNMILDYFPLNSEKKKWKGY